MMILGDLPKMRIQQIDLDSFRYVTKVNYILNRLYFEGFGGPTKEEKGQKLTL